MEDNDSSKNLSRNVSAKRIRERRSEFKITRKDLAEKVGISTQVLDNIENGRTKFLSLRDMEVARITFHLRCTKDYLLGKSDEPSKLENGSIVPFMIDPEHISKEEFEKAIREFPEGFNLLYEANLKLSSNEKDILVKIIKALLNNY